MKKLLIGKWEAVIGVIVLVSAVVRLYLAALCSINYDDYWLIFVARQDNWKKFLWDAADVTHPFFLYFPLKAAIWFGHNMYAYRFFSLLSGVASIWLIAQIAGKLSKQWFAPPLAALLFALSYAPIEMSLELKGYSLGTFFVLVSFYFHIDRSIFSRNIRDSMVSIG